MSTLILPGEPKLEGIFREDGTLKHLGTVELPNGDTAYVAANGVLYRYTEGNVRMMVPVKKEKLCKQTKVNPEGIQAWYYGHEQDAEPPAWVLWQLHERLFGKYDHEVLVLLGRKKDGTWVASVPAQVCTSGDAEIDEREDDGGGGIALIEAGASPTGIAHCHPGTWTDRSSTDDALFQKVPGIHPILSADGKRYSIHVSVEGFIATTLRDFQPTDEDRRKPEGAADLLIVTSKGRPLEELIQRPKPRITPRYAVPRYPYQGGSRYWEGGEHRWHKMQEARKVWSPQTREEKNKAWKRERLLTMDSQARQRAHRIRQLYAKVRKGKAILDEDVIALFRGIPADSAAVVWDPERCEYVIMNRDFMSDDLDMDNWNVQLSNDLYSWLETQSLEQAMIEEDREGRPPAFPNRSSGGPGKNPSDWEDPFGEAYRAWYGDV